MLTEKNKVLAGMIIGLTIFWCFNIIISVLAVTTEDAIFKHKIQDVLNSHTIQITPDGYTFLIWPLIFLWTLSGYIFLIVCIFKTSSDRYGKLFCTPEVFTIPIAGTLLLNCALYTSWLFVWDNGYMTATCVLLFCIMATSWVALALFTYCLFENTPYLQDRSPLILNTYRVLILNSLGVYATWTTIAALVNFSIALVHDAEIENPMASIISLSILTVIVGIWVPLDLFLLDKYCRYLVTPLFVVMWALIGIFSRAQKITFEDETPKNFTMGLIGMMTVLLACKIGLTIFCAVKQPLT